MLCNSWFITRGKLRYLILIYSNEFLQEEETLMSSLVSKCENSDQLLFILLFGFSSKHETIIEKTIDKLTKNNDVTVDATMELLCLFIEQPSLFRRTGELTIFISIVNFAAKQFKDPMSEHHEIVRTILPYIISLLIDQSMINHALNMYMSCTNSAFARMLYFSFDSGLQKMKRYFENVYERYHTVGAVEVPLKYNTIKKSKLYSVKYNTIAKNVQKAIIKIQ